MEENMSFTKKEMKESSVLNWTSLIIEIISFPASRGSFPAVC